MNYFRFECTTGLLNTPKIRIGQVSVVKLEDHCEVGIIACNGDLVHARSIKFETARQFANAILSILDGDYSKVSTSNTSTARITHNDEENEE
jgi:hypothetical protein